MRCPKCKKEKLRKQILLKGIIFKKKIVIYYCPICNFESVTKFKLSRIGYEIETKKLKEEALNQPKKMIYQVSKRRR